MISVAIAEDDFRVAAIHEEFLLKAKDVRVIGKALNAKETLKLLENEAVDLLLLDIFMPDILGTEILHTIRKNYPTVDIIMITAATEKELVETSLRYGVVDYIIKPLSLERFVEAIENYKKKKQLLKTKHQIDQQMIDQFFGHLNSPTDSTNNQLPKGIDPLTLRKVKQIMKTINHGVTAEEMGEKMGASRTTARRYLEYLTSIGEGKAELEYGIVGRPERRYHLSQTS